MQIRRFSNEFDRVVNRAFAASLRGKEDKALKIIKKSELSRDPVVSGHLAQAVVEKVHAWQCLNP